MKMDKKNYPQVYLEEYTDEKNTDENKMKKIQMSRFIKAKH